MFSPRRLQSAQSGSADLSILERSLTRMRRRSSTSQTLDIAHDSVGTYGLNLLYTPPVPLLELIFVHGLRGGSRKTWSHSSDPFSYWPKEWLPRDPEFKNARIFSFGYNSDWGERKDSLLSLQDFGKYLLSEMMHSPDIKQQGDTPVIFIGHSMGGLVMKQTYILATRDPSAKAMADRIHGMVFLATPHRGADIAALLGNMLKASVLHGEKPFVTDLERNSISISSINDEFRHYAHGLELLSFYETLKTNLGVTSSLIVSKESATLGYSNERSSLLNATHRSICKFESPLDPNYISLRNALAVLAKSSIQQITAQKRDQYRAERLALQDYLGVTEIPDDDLEPLDVTKLGGSCEWFTWKEEFQAWQDSHLESHPYFWLNAQQAAGKSVMAAHVIRFLEGTNSNCSYYFFKHNDQSKTTLSGCLRSLAYQMSLDDVRISQKILLLKEESVRFDLNNELAIWRKLFLGGIFEISVSRPHFWVIDGLDECNSPVNIMSLLSNGTSGFPLRVFMTSRPTSNVVREVSHLGGLVHIHEMTAQDTCGDIELYLQAYVKDLPLVDDLSRQSVTKTILEKSGGSFLWVALVLEELRTAFSKNNIQQILTVVPQGMDPLYQRALDLISQTNRGKHLIKAILSWTVCAIRPLTLEELENVLELDLGEHVLALDKFIASNCWQFVQVERGKKVSLIHETVRAFLLREDLKSEFAVNKRGSHSRIADICLQYLCSDQMKPPRSQRLLYLYHSKIAKRSPFAKYASEFFSQHLRRSYSEEVPRFLSLCSFLGGNVFSWIEHIARTGNLQHLVQAAKDMKGYLQARAKYHSPLGKHVQLVDVWASDLIRLVSQFGKNLIESPSVIFWLIPPFCPPMTAIGNRSESASHGITINGLSSQVWSDRISCIHYRDLQTRAVACAHSTFAVSLSDKSINTYSRSTCQQTNSIKCSQSAKLIVYTASERFLAYSSIHFLTMFNLSTGQQIWQVRLPHECITIVFADQGKTVWIVTKGGILSSLSVESGTRLTMDLLVDPSELGSDTPFQRIFTAAAISLEFRMVAAVQRGRPIGLYDMEGGTFLGLCEKDDAVLEREDAALIWVRDFVFSPDTDMNSLVSLYHDGQLVLFDPCEMSVKTSVQANAQVLACSPDGRTLATGSDTGTIQLFDLESLTLIHKLIASDQSIKSLAFSSDGLRFVDVRGSQCNIWEPSVLVHQNSRENDSVSDTVPQDPTIVGIASLENLTDITALACHYSGDYVFCGKDNGTVALYSAATGTEIQVLYNHVLGTEINYLACQKNSDLIVSADASSRFMVWRIIKKDHLMAEGPLLDARIQDYSISQIILNPTNNRILVSTKVSDTVYDIESGQHKSSTFPERESWKWVDHPRDPTKLIHITAKSAHVHSWDDLPEPTFKVNLKLDADVHTGMLVKDVAACSDGCKLSIEFTKANSLQSASNVLILGTESFEEPFGSIIQSLPPFAEITSKIEHIIGSLGRKLLFLDQKMWVCSLDLENFNGECYRHFFIPEDWLSVNRGMILKVTSKSDLVFVKRDEIAVIKQGLAYKEVVSV
ncbi:Vegetative incompatibility protein HET-E-1 [Lachnellula arida]|uniref:GPI inositol-deacylase n=1 Tax=Lachnellula arida TaxID=1316785 RepID=A0A8T9B357_9HELO|nr:Vegetative incompatibility protein HET-E-1 [Lachnellula arida]